MLVSYSGAPEEEESGCLQWQEAVFKVQGCTALIILAVGLDFRNPPSQTVVMFVLSKIILVLPVNRQQYIAKLEVCQFHPDCLPFRI